MLLCFTPLTLFGAFIAWVWIPDVQETRDKDSKEEERKGNKVFKKCLLMPPRSLEDITANPTGIQIFGMRKHLRHFFGRDEKKDQKKLLPGSNV